MFKIIIKDNSPDLEVTVTRALLAIAALACLGFSLSNGFAVSIFSAVILFGISVFVKQIRQRFSYPQIWILAIASMLLFISTRSVSFVVILILSGSAIHLLKKQPEVEIGDEGVTIKKIFSQPLYPWNEFSNVILKDNLLTLDFLNNQLLQLTVDDSQTSVNEQMLNEFCQKHLLQAEDQSLK